MRGAWPCALWLAATSCTNGPGRDASVDGIDVMQDDCDAALVAPSPNCPVIGRDENACIALAPGYGLDGTLDGYRAFVPGDHVVVTPGPQGLQHILVAFRGAGFDPTNPLIDARIVRPGDCHTVGEIRFRLPFTPDPNDTTQLALPAVRLTIVDGTDSLVYCSILGADVVLVVDFDDASGHVAHREVRLHVDGIDPNAPPDIYAAWNAACDRLDASAGDAP